MGELAPEIQEMIHKIRQGDRRILGRLITLVENRGPEFAHQVIHTIFPDTGQAYIVGVTGSPGAGKSTIVNQLITQYLAQGLKVSVIAVDPTSPFSGGALLGDRIRMHPNFTQKNLFIRSMANRGTLGGLAMATKDIIQILDAFGSDIIIVETVGVGQSEIDIFKSAHTTLVVLVPGMGDEIQAIKAGIMEITDIFVVNKADMDGADKRVGELEGMLDLSGQIEVDYSHHDVRIIRSEGWRPPVIKTNAITGENISELILLIAKHRSFLEANGLKTQRFMNRYKHYIVDILKYMSSKNIEAMLFGNPQINEYIEKIFKYEEGNDPYTIADEIYRKFLAKMLRS